MTLLQRLLMGVSWGSLNAAALEGEGVDPGAAVVKPNGVVHADSDDDDDNDDPELLPPGDDKRKISEWQAYSKRLRKENAAKRTMLNTAKGKHAALEGEVSTWKTKYDTDLAATKTAADAARDTAVKAANDAATGRLVNLELKFALMAEGCKEIDDALKLADVSGIKVSETGEVDAATVKAAAEALKKAKPFLFGTASTTTTSTSKVPGTTGNGEPKSALDMTDEEYRAGKAALTKMLPPASMKR